MRFCVAAAVGADSPVALGAFLLDHYVHVLVNLCCCSRTRLLATYQAQQVSLQMNFCVIIFIIVNSNVPPRHHVSCVSSEMCLVQDLE